MNPHHLHLLAALGDVLLGLSGLFASLDYFQKSKHFRTRWLARRWVSVAKSPGVVQIRGSDPVYLVPRARSQVQEIALQEEAASSRFAKMGLVFLSLGLLCLLTYHGLSILTVDQPEFVPSVGPKTVRIETASGESFFSFAGSSRR